jgi:hypothetical protein
MTFPLVVLGILAVIGGWVGIPEALKGHDHFFRWFAPIFAYEEFFAKIEARGHGLELLLAIATLLWGRPSQLVRERPLFAKARTHAAIRREDGKKSAWRWSISSTWMRSMVL